MSKPSASPRARRKTQKVEPLSSFAVTFTDSSLALSSTGTVLGDAAFNFDQVRALDPLAAYAYSGRGLMRYLKRDFDGAIDDCNRAIRINPRLADAYNHRGISHSARKDFDAAMKDFNRALALDPRDAKALNNRGNTHSENGDFDKDAQAEQDFDRALALAPSVKVELKKRIELVKQWRQRNRQ